MVQQGAPDVEQRAEHDVGEREGGTLARVALGVQQPLQGDLRDDDDEHERREGAEGVDEVGAPETAAAGERRAEREPLHETRRHREADEGEPGDCGQHEERA